MLYIYTVRRLILSLILWWQRKQNHCNNRKSTYQYNVLFNILLKEFYWHPHHFYTPNLNYISIYINKIRLLSAKNPVIFCIFMFWESQIPHSSKTWLSVCLLHFYAHFSFKKSNWFSQDIRNIWFTNLWQS